MVFLTGLILAVAGLYCIFYIPLAKRLRLYFVECKTAENEVREARNLVHLVGEFYSERVLITEEELSQAISELTSHGKSRGVNFITINPGAAEETKNLQYKILPVELVIESTYEQLGRFMGSLDGLNKGIFKVKKFNIAPSEKGHPILITDLTVDLYLATEGKYAE